MKNWAVRLGHIWKMVPGNHKIAIRVKKMDGTGFYSDGFYDSLIDPCPAVHQTAPVISIYAVSKEILEITINERND